METEELQELLEAGHETPELDYKASCPWDASSFAKDILAMSNLEDVSYIVIGVEELENGSFNSTGVENTHIESYKIDIMKDQMAAFAEPHVNFSVHFCDDKKKQTYVVIKVFPFKEIPVICKKDLHDSTGKRYLTKAGTIYFRNRNKRVQSASISNSFDMRTILERAAFKKMRKLLFEIESADLKIIPKQTVSEKLDDEIRDLS